jgi:hypothetical protein
LRRFVIRAHERDRHDLTVSILRDRLPVGRARSAAIGVLASRKSGETYEACPASLRCARRGVSTWEGRTWPLVSGQLGHHPRRPTLRRGNR